MAANAAAAATMFGGRTVELEPSRGCVNGSYRALELFPKPSQETVLKAVRER